MSSQSWSIVVLCYNEAANITRVIDAVSQSLRTIAPAQHEIVVVDDGSRDGSVEIVRAIAEARSDVRLLEHGVNKGIGEALRTGYSAARMENVCAVPGDGQFDLDELLPFAVLPKGSFVSFTRRNNTEYSPYRRALSRINRQINGWLLGATLQDANWVKIYKRADLERLTFEMHSSLLQSEISMKLLMLGRTVVEPDSRYLRRAGGNAKGGSWRVVAQAARETLTLMRVMRRFRRGLPRA